MLMPKFPHVWRAPTPRQDQPAKPKPPCKTCERIKRALGLPSGR